MGSGEIAVAVEQPGGINPKAESQISKEIRSPKS
jgi:hypothetical protein